MNHLPWDGFPGGEEVKNSPANAGNARKAGAVSGLGRSPKEMENGNPFILAFLPGKSQGPRSLAGHRSRGHKQSDTTEGLSPTKHMPRGLCY